MSPEMKGAGPRAIAETGPQDAFSSTTERTEDSQNTPANQPKIEAGSASPKSPGKYLSDAVRECRKRVALDDIWHALSPVSRHSEAALLCIECEDFDGLEHHLGLVVDRVRKAAGKHKELRALLKEATKQ
jgi:hypothetical protein